MTKSRLEAFSDGVIAIIITIMVLELRPPEGATIESLREVAPFFLTYALSFLVLGIYWNNHHHLLHTVDRVTGGIMWANLHLLFWLTLVPFGTAWMAEHPAEPFPVGLYGGLLLASAIAFYILVQAILRSQGPDGRLARAIGRDFKGKMSPVAYTAGILVSPVAPWLSIAIYTAVALIWLVPDTRVERMMGLEEKRERARR
jgi:uncharacterized membrane protein